MVKYKGTDIVEVFGEATISTPGGMMVGCGSALGVFRQPSMIFFFIRNNQKYRVTNVRKAGRYRANQLRGL